MVTTSAVLVGGCGRPPRPGVAAKTRAEVPSGAATGIGGSGGVFAPSLFGGAMLGSAFGAGAHRLLPGTAGPVGAYWVIDMGAVFAGAARAPVTAVVIMFELAGEYTVILPLMAAIVLATGVSKALARDTIYPLKPRRRGVDLDETLGPQPPPRQPDGVRTSGLPHPVHPGRRSGPEPERRPARPGDAPGAGNAANGRRPAKAPEPRGRPHHPYLDWERGASRARIPGRVAYATLPGVSREPGLNPCASEGESGGPRRTRSTRWARCADAHKRPRTHIRTAS